MLCFCQRSHRLKQFAVAQMTIFYHSLMPSGIATFLSRAGCSDQRLANECPKCFVSPSAAVGGMGSRVCGSVQEDEAALGEEGWEAGYKGRGCTEPPAWLAGAGCLGKP